METKEVVIKGKTYMLAPVNVIQFEMMLAAPSGTRQNVILVTSCLNNADGEAYTTELIEKLPIAVFRELVKAASDVSELNLKKDEAALAAT